AGQLRLRRNQVEVRETRRLRELADRCSVEQVKGRRPVRMLAEPGSGVRLGIEVDDQRPLTGFGQARGEVDRRRGLADAALLIRECVDLRHAGSVLTPTDAYARGPYGVETPTALARVCAGRAVRRAHRRPPRRVAAPPSQRPRRPRKGRSRARPRRRAARAASTTRPPPAPAPAPLRQRRRRRRAPAPPPTSPRPCRRSGLEGAQPRRTSHLRPLASGSVTGRSGSAAASGIPGTPPPEPTSTIGPPKRVTTSTPRSESSNSARRAVSTSVIAVNPGVVTSAWSQRQSRSSASADRRRGSITRAG